MIKAKWTIRPGIQGGVAILASDAARFTKNANAMNDAQLAGKAGDPARIKAATGPMRSPEQLAAYTHMSDYCGAKL